MGEDRFRKLGNRLFQGTRWTLVAYDAVVMLVVSVFVLLVYPGSLIGKPIPEIISHICILTIGDLFSRIVFGVYRIVWRFSDPKGYIRLIWSDVFFCAVYVVMRVFLEVRHLSAFNIVAIVCLNLLGAECMRIFYQFIFQTQRKDSAVYRFLQNIFYHLTGVNMRDLDTVPERIRIAIVGAGNCGVALADELKKNRHSAYQAVCFIERDEAKIGREIIGIPVLRQSDLSQASLKRYGVQEFVFALSMEDETKKQELYTFYSQFSLRMMVYDYPVLSTSLRKDNRRELRDFSIEELLFRKPREFMNDLTRSYYRDHVILITGGGGSIGSELCRQLAAMQPRQIIIVDIYENNAYDIQQELKILYGDSLDLRVEIVSICNKVDLEKVFDRYRPEIVLHAAAHKHVPLMEHNVCEAVNNNVFGTLNVVRTAEKYGTKRLIMISTDKAVNPTNVMGATKRMCEMIVLNHRSEQMLVSATRFGNVLGSNGSVIPLFRRQIANGGPITVTSKDIIRYFMTIPEASQLVLISGQMAKNRQLFVLNMGEPVKIWDLAESMIRLSGFEPHKDIKIEEVGLRQGEKMYEELLIKGENISATDNDMIFIEEDKELSEAEIEEKLEILRKAAETNDDDITRQALKSVVPTFRTPGEVNGQAAETSKN